MRTGQGARLLLLALSGASVCLGFLSLREAHRLFMGAGAQGSGEFGWSWVVGNFAPQLVVVGGVGAVVSLVGFFVLGELQAQTAARSGPVKLPRSKPRKRLRFVEEGPTGGELRIGRGDSWS